MPWVYVPKSWNNIHAMSDFRLKVFCCVARNLSYTKAAQELFISQPAVTKHVKELENHYQTRLFERLGSRIELTHAGRLLLDHREAILEAYNRLEFEMNLLRNEYSGELRLGASTTIAQYVLPPLLAQFIEKFPHITVSMFNGNSREVEVALQEHRIDLALLEGSSRLPSLKYAHFLDDELVMVMRTKSRLAVADEISANDKCLSQSVRAGLNGVGQMHTELMSVSQQFMKTGRILGSGDDKYITDTRIHENRHGIVDHGFIINRKKLFGCDHCQRIKPCGIARCYHYILHCLRFLWL